MEKKFKNIVLEYLKPNDKIVVAVSGGVDSVVLLSLTSKYSKNLVVAHVNHGLRRQSNKEEEFVRKLGQKYGLAVYVKKLNLKNTSEEEARRKRYEFLRQIKSEIGAKYIVTAHHLNDQAETIILNLTRGAGPLAVWGMKSISGDIFRPLLAFSKKEIEDYAKKEPLKFVSDKSNLETKYARNRIRHNVIPELRKINPEFLKTILSEVQLGQAAAEELKNIAEKAEKKVRFENELSISALKKLTPFVQSYIVYQMLSDMMGDRVDIYRKNVDQVFRILTKPGAKKTEIRGFTIEKIYDKIIFDSRLGKKGKQKKRAKLEPGQKIEFNGFQLEEKVGKGEPAKKNILLPLDYAYNLNIRTWETGDKIKTKSGTKKLQDIFMNAKISPHDRKIWPIVTYRNKIVWVPLLAASAKAIHKSTEDSLIINVTLRRAQGGNKSRVKK